ncbi:integrin beta-PS [Anabrus simplex]|uniref:integrin beta-PS n=1 Tax=Anabrus simplex TaxID=316456 RepID=UPI0035A29CF7
MSPVKWYCCCLVLLQSLAVYTENICSLKASCRECISTPDCYWCSKPVKGEADDVHCVEKSKVVEGWCSDDSKEEYRTEYHKKEAKTSSQIQPQRSRLRLRLGEEYNIQIRFVKARDYPVDLYYLLDLSNSMLAQKDMLSDVTDDLTNAMKDLTSNFRLGFGSFVDKVTMPYVLTMPDRLKHPCDGCASPYSFKNHMPLDVNTSLFKHSVSAAPISGNIDSPEGGFDALMQAMICTDRIKWREDARRLLVFSTDAIYHLAGDGRLGGIIEPNDGLCHMNDEEEYTAGLLYDYPSIAQLDNTAVENNINIIFAVTSKVKEDYLSLSEYITGSSCGVLSKDFKNIAELVHAQSEKLTQRVEITGVFDKRVKVHYYSKCLNPDGELMETDKCEKVKPNDKITFEARVKVTECPPEYDTVWNTTLYFKPVGINETLEVELQVYCGCQCEKKEEHNSSYCSSGGTLRCGICECNKGLTGRLCQCDKSSMKSGDLDDSNCRIDNNSRVCSGHGTCRCGVCDCYKGNGNNQVYSGKYCQCDNFSCNRYEGKLCNGLGECKCGNCHCLLGWKGDACQIRDNRKECIDPFTKQECSGHGKCDDGICICDQEYTGKYCEECLVHSDKVCLCDDISCKRHEGKLCNDLGECKCGNCQCSPGWKGDACEIYDDVEKCKDPFTKEVCSGYGKCVDGNCTCNEGYGGKYCEHGWGYLGSRCKVLGECLECFLYDGEECDNLCTTHYNITINEVVDTLTEEDAKENEDEYFCLYPDDSGCLIIFIYKEKEGLTNITAQKEKECRGDGNIWAVVFGVIGGTLLIGLLFIILWKVMTTVYDNREYAKFEKERERSKFDRGENPLFRGAVTKFDNPTFNAN